MDARAESPIAARARHWPLPLHHCTTRVVIPDCCTTFRQENRIPEGYVTSTSGRDSVTGYIVTDALDAPVRRQYTGSRRPIELPALRRSPSRSRWADRGACGNPLNPCSPVSPSIGARGVHRAAPLANTQLTRTAWRRTCASRVQVSDV